MTEVALFSKDKRSSDLFRRTWVNAFARQHITVKAVNRGYGLVFAFTAALKFIRAKNSIRVVFGTSEILLYSLFSKKSDVWVFTGMGRLFLRKNYVYVIVKNMFRILYRSQTIIVLNVDDQVFLEQKMGFKSYVLPGEGYAFGPEMPFLTKTDDITSTKTVAYVGRLLRSKGVHILVKHLKDYYYPNLNFVFLGDTDFNSSDAVSKKAIMEASKSKNNVQFYGFIDDVASVLKNVDFQISMSDREGLPFSVLDGIVCGCCMVLTDVPGHRSFFRLNGIEKFDAPNLGDILRKINDFPDPLLNFDRYERFRLVEEEFGQERVMRDIIRIFNNEVFR